MAVRWWWQGVETGSLGREWIRLDYHLHRTRRAAERCGNGAAELGLIDPDFEVFTDGPADAGELGQ